MTKVIDAKYETKRWKRSEVPTSHRNEDTTGRTSSIKKKQRKKRQNPTSKERTRSNNKNSRRGDDQQNIQSINQSRQEVKQERSVHENVCILIGPGRKRELQVIRTRLYRFFLHSFEQVVGRIIAVKQVTVGYLNNKIIYKSAGTDAVLEMFCHLIRLRTTSVPS
ncbi:hypothetical protein TNCV_2920981 [Trichonephila clavipes]|nr:hypothetical protein TNCV_2920981 [Trichonephila clavipes]